jgi:hypothetical protein
MRHVKENPAEKMYRLGVHVVLDVELRPEGGVAIVGKDIYWVGVRLPRTGLKIEFRSHVGTDPDGGEFVEVIGGSKNQEPACGNRDCPQSRSPIPLSVTVFNPAFTLQTAILLDGFASPR